MEAGVAADFVSLIDGSGSLDELAANYFQARDAAAAAKDKRATDSFAKVKNRMYRSLSKAAQ